MKAHSQGRTTGSGLKRLVERRQEQRDVLATDQAVARRVYTTRKRNKIAGGPGHSSGTER